MSLHAALEGPVSTALRPQHTGFAFLIEISSRQGTANIQSLLHRRHHIRPQYHSCASPPRILHLSATPLSVKTCMPCPPLPNVHDSVTWPCPVVWFVLPLFFLSLSGWIQIAMSFHIMAHTIRTALIHLTSHLSHLILPLATHTPAACAATASLLLAQAATQDVDRDRTIEPYFSHGQPTDSQHAGRQCPGGR